MQENYKLSVSILVNNVSQLMSCSEKDHIRYETHTCNVAFVTYLESIAEKIARILKRRKDLGRSKETKQREREKVRRKVHLEQSKLLQSRTLRETCHCEYRTRPYVLLAGQTPKDFVRIYVCLCPPYWERCLRRIECRTRNEFPVRGIASYPFNSSTRLQT